MGIFMLLGWVLIIVGVVFLVRWVLQQTQGRSERASTSDSGEDALEILRKRYARGEIDREEYERRRRDLLA
ncbi:MAG: hypothetical protein KatS3mg115_0877 [Candidatus Poribacteria bacterium]|nr:MAG: hypothetical protein KatS3mg115_0877 [Candidatus Poribacteria bacterium]